MRYSGNRARLLHSIATTLPFKPLGTKGGVLSNPTGKTKNYIVDGRKVCPRCLQNKLISEYHFSPKKMSSYCKGCHRLITKANYAKTWLIQKSQELFRLFGITLEQWKTLFVAQERRCAICGISGEDVVWHTDHDHATGKFRGILCRACNHLIGNAKDDPRILVAAIAYLRPAVEIQII
jgi:hypothetical protein